MNESHEGHSIVDVAAAIFILILAFYVLVKIT